MAVTAAATASGRNLFNGGLTTTTGTTLYTAPAQSANVTSPSATAYVKEILLCNTTTSAIAVTITLNGQAIVSGLSISPSDTKILGGLNTMMPAGTVLAGNASATGVTCLISGVEVQ